jgi:hypothetical protein
VSSQSGHVNPQNRKSRRTLSVFWSMKTSSKPTPVNETMAPASSPPAWGLGAAVRGTLAHHHSPTW